MGIFKKLFGKKEVKEDTKPLIVIDDVLKNAVLKIWAITISQTLMLQPYKTYVRVNGRMSISERGVYEQGNYGWKLNTVVLSKE